MLHLAGNSFKLSHSRRSLHHLSAKRTSREKGNADRCLRFAEGGVVTRNEFELAKETDIAIRLDNGSLSQPDEHF